MLHVNNYVNAVTDIATLHSVEAESALLGGLLLDNSAMGHVGSLTAGDFFVRVHGLIFSAIVTLANTGQPVDVITIFEKLQSTGHAEEIGGQDYLNALAQYVPSFGNIRRYAEIVRDRSLRRATIEVALDTQRPLLEIAKFAAASASDNALTEWVPAVKDVPTFDLKKLVQDVRVCWVVENLIQAAKVGALVAAGGTGKTTLLLHLFVCIATGRQFLGRNVKQGSTVLLTNDDPQEDMVDALALVCRAMSLSDAEYAMVEQKVRVVSLQGLGGIKTFATSVGGTTMATGLTEALLQAVEDINDLVMVALDTLRQFSGGSSNDEQVIKLTIAGSTEFAVKTGAAVILPHHTGKQNYRDEITDMYAGSGSAAIADNCRFVLLLQTAKWSEIAQQVARAGREEGDPLVLRSTRGSLLVKAPEPIFLHRDGFHLGVIAGKALTRDQQLDRRDREILAAVRSGAQSKNAVAIAVKGKKLALNNAVDDLLQRQLLVFEASTGLRGSSQKLMISASGSKVLDTKEVA